MSTSEQDRGDEEGPRMWAAAAAPLRRVLQVLQQRGLLGAEVSTQQALAAFQNACYAGCQAQGPE